MATHQKLKGYIDEFGIHIPSYPEVLEGLKSEFRAIYGSDLYLEADSQEGQLCSVFALHIYDSYALASSVYNSFSPHTAQGVGLSSVVKTNGIRRGIASHSQAELRVIGQAGTVINNGVASDDAGNRWMLPKNVIIPLAGEITVTAISEKEGEVRVAPLEIKNIATPTRGWQAVLNEKSAIKGSPVEKDSSLRIRQTMSTALPSLSIFDGTIGAIASLEGVTRSRGYENDTSIVDKNGLPAHSISFVVEGGDTQKIASTIALKKGPGCATYGDVNCIMRDQKGSPLSINFFRPSVINIAISIQIKPLAGYLSNTGETIRKNLAEYINTLPIGEDILTSKLYTPINTAEPMPNNRSFDIVSLTLGKKGDALNQANLQVPFNASVSCEIDEIDLKEYEIA